MSVIRRFLAALSRLFVPHLDLRAATHAIAGPAAVRPVPAPLAARPRDPDVAPASAGAPGTARRVTKVEPLPARFGRRPPRRTESEGWPRE